MVRDYSMRFLLVLTFILSACASIVPTVAPVQEATAAPLAGLSVDQLENAQYQLGTRDDHAVVQLADGKFQQGVDTVDYASIVLSDFVAIGDLNGDGVNEAAAIFFENYGGTGNFAMLAIYVNVNDAPVFLTSVLIDDRPMINGIAIENGELYLDAVTHSFDDPACCPTLSTTRRYALTQNQLRIIYYSTNTADGKKREIEITTPAQAAEVSGNVQVSGSVSIAPFENNLSYFIYDEAGNQYAVGPVTVTAPDFGAPGTFDFNVAFESIPAGTVVYLEIQDISAADGSWLAMDAVKLLVK